MARYTGTVDAPHSAEVVWHYLADLRSVEEWDPIRRVGDDAENGLRERLRKQELGGPAGRVRG